VTGLSKDDFIISQKESPLQITTFTIGKDPKLGRSIILIIDRSESQLPFIKTSIDSAKILVERLGPLDKMAIVRDDVKLVMDFTSERDKLVSALESLTKGGTSGGISHALQYSALMATLRELVRRDQRTIILFQTDGDELRLLRPSDPNSDASFSRQFSLKDIYSEAEKSRATIYSIIPGFCLIGLSPSDQLAQIKRYSEQMIKYGAPPIDFWKSIIRKDPSDPSIPELIEGPLSLQLALTGVAKLTGGTTDFLENPTQAEPIYRRILDDANQRYLLGFQPPTNGSDKKRKNVNIQVRGHPEYTIIGRKSYYE
jgi:VWFA-related protein